MKVVGWIFIPFVMIFLRWKKINWSIRSIAIIWSILVFPMWVGLIEGVFGNTDQSSKANSTEVKPAIVAETESSKKQDSTEEAADTENKLNYLSEQFSDNFGQTTWGSNVKSLSLTKNFNGEYEVKVSTDMFPKESNKPIGKSMAQGVFAIAFDRFYVSDVIVTGQNENIITIVRNPMPRKD